MKTGLFLVAVCAAAIAIVFLDAKTRQDNTPLTLTGAEFINSVALGEAAFFDHACWRCHALGDMPLPGNQDLDHVGPDLAGVADRLDADAIGQSITDPNAVIAKPEADHTDEAGNSFMPPMGDAMSREVLQQLVTFLTQQRSIDQYSANNVLDVSEATFAREVEQADTLVLLDFWAEWCLPCLELEPVLNEVAAEFGSRIKVCKINVDENPDLVKEYVPDNMFPCLVLMRDGKVVDRRYGTDPKMDPKDFLLQWITKELR